MDLSAAQFRGYVEQHSDQIIDDAFLSFGSADLMTHIPNNKGKAIIGKGSVSENIVRKHKVLRPGQGRQSVDVGILEVESFRGQFHEEYVPENLEKNYYGYLRQNGQNPQDFPFEAYVLMLLTKSLRQWHEKMLWNSVKNDATDDGTDLFDGLNKQLTDAIASGAITPMAFGTPYRRRPRENTAPPTGFTPMVDIIEDMYVNGVPDAWKEMGVSVFMQRKNKTMYNQDYRNAYGTAPTTQKLFDIDRSIIDGTEDIPAYLFGVGGLSGSDRIIMTPKANVVYTYDNVGDATLFRMQYILNALNIWGTFRVGAKFLVLTDDWLVCNELA